MRMWTHAWLKLYGGVATTWRQQYRFSAEELKNCLLFLGAEYDSPV